MTKKDIKSLVKLLKEYNKAYRNGTPLVSDSIYDEKYDLLLSVDPNNPFFNEIGITVIDEGRKSKLPIDMASMNKVKTLEEIYAWMISKGIDIDSDLVLSPKFDGLSFCVEEQTDKSWTRGDGIFGQSSDEHYSLINNKLKTKLDVITYGEVMMLKSVFNDKYSMDFANPRNLVAGLLNSKEVTNPLSDLHYIKYGMVSDLNFKTKSEIFDLLNKNQDIKVNYKVVKFKDLTEEYLVDLFKEWSVDFEIDGVIIEVNDLTLQNKLGRERSNNPCYARAFKSPSFESSATTKVIGLSWNISKQGLLKPIIHIDPVKLDGVTISNVTGNNARFIKDNGIGIGATVVVKRSGMVIPIIASVVDPVEFQMPDVPNIDWNENGVELITLEETDDQKLKKNISFFETLEAKNISEGVITQLWNAGYTTIKEILDLKPTDLEKLDGFGKRKSTIVYNAIQSSIQDVELPKLQHASNIFGNGLGSKKLALLEHFTTKPTINDVMSIEGFAEKSAKNYVDNYDKFFEFISELPIKLKSKEKNQSSDDNSMEGCIFVFTGVRRKDLVAIIESRGGKESNSLSKTTTHLVCADKSSGSSKMVKAKSLGVTIMDVEELESFLNS